MAAGTLRTNSGLLLHGSGVKMWRVGGAATWVKYYWLRRGDANIPLLPVIVGTLKYHHVAESIAEPFSTQYRAILCVSIPPAAESLQEGKGDTQRQSLYNWQDSCCNWGGGTAVHQLYSSHVQ